MPRPRNIGEALMGIERSLRADSPDSGAISGMASVASGHLSFPQRSRAPRAWLDQMVPGQNHLCVRRRII